MTIAIDKGIPVPNTKQRGGGRTGAYPFDAMQPGDSIKVPVGDKAKSAVRENLRNTAYAWARSRGLKASFVTAYEDEKHVRLWLKSREQLAGTESTNSKKG